MDEEKIHQLPNQRKRMSNWLVLTLGFSAQLFFSIRLISQWFLTEKNKKVITPTLFWKFSLLGTIFLFIYGYFRKDFAIMLGQSITYFIYIRNMHLQKEWQKLHFSIRLLLLLFPFVLVYYGFNNSTKDTEQIFGNPDISRNLFYLGVISQLIFVFRFIYQWIYSERKKESDLPMGFWLLSFLGSSLILIYAFFREDIVLILGQGFGLIAYARNIVIKKNEKQQ